MKTEIKQEWKGMFKGIVLTFFIIGVFTAGAGYATTIISDTGITIDSNTVLVEGDYTNWTHKWTEDFPAGRYARDDVTFFIDDKNDVLILNYYDDNSKTHFTIRDLSDFGAVYDSGGSYQTYDAPDSTYARSAVFGAAAAHNGGISKSLQTYTLLLQGDGETIEVWRSGSSAVWSHNITNEVAGDGVYSLIISPTGKWIVVNVYAAEKLICYEGS